MNNPNILVVSGELIHSLLAGRELDIIQAVKSAYLAHAAGKTSLPHSLFLRFPGNEADRIIALPAYLHASAPIAGLKWISSFPGNLKKGLDRASAIVVLNSPETGRPEAILEGSIISAKRTAASAALAAMYLGRDKPYESLGIIGCGLINYEISRFLRCACPGLVRLVLFDRDGDKAKRVARVYSEVAAIPDVRVVDSIDDVLSDCDLISFATVASNPHVTHLSQCVPGCTILHISLRDLSAEAVLSADNIVDDIDHVCRAGTSLHLAEQKTGNRRFIRCCLADVINQTQPPRPSSSSATVFSPFGLGILDLAVADLALASARDRGCGMPINSFFPEPWIGQQPGQH